MALLSIGEEETKGNPLVQGAHKLLADPSWIGDTGRSSWATSRAATSSTDAADVVVTDGFTGNVALKTLEGGMRALVNGVLSAFDTDDATREAAQVLLPALAPLYAQLDPENVGGAMLLGVDGVCIISHGSSSRHGHGQCRSRWTTTW